MSSLWKVTMYSHRFSLLLWVVANKIQGRDIPKTIWERFCLKQNTRRLIKTHCKPQSLIQKKKKKMEMSARSLPKGQTAHHLVSIQGALHIKIPWSDPGHGLWPISIRNSLGAYQENEILYRTFRGTWRLHHTSPRSPQANTFVQAWEAILSDF